MEEQQIMFEAFGDETARKYDELKKRIPKRGAILTDLDECFDAIALAAMEWEPLVHVLGEKRERVFREVAEALSEPYPDFTDEESAGLATWLTGGAPNYGADGKVRSYAVPEPTPEARAACESHQVREDAWLARRTEARVRFVREVLPSLWT